MKVVGITGGIGSGKSVFLNYISENYNAHIIESDKLAKELMLPGQAIYNDVVRAFGVEVLEECVAGNPIDSAKLGGIVFSSNEKLELLNSITHPGVKKHILSVIEQHRKKDDVDYVVIEAALLIEDGYKDICDYIINVYVDKETRINRLMEGRGYTREKCESVIASQSDDEYYKKYADYTINNEKRVEDSLKLLNEILK